MSVLRAHLVYRILKIMNRGRGIIQRLDQLRLDIDAIYLRTQLLFLFGWFRPTARAHLWLGPRSWRAGRCFHPPTLPGRLTLWTCYFLLCFCVLSFGRWWKAARPSVGRWCMHLIRAWCVWITKKSLPTKWKVCFLKPDGFFFDVSAVEKM